MSTASYGLDRTFSTASRPLLGEVHDEPGGLQDLPGHLLVDLVVLGHEQAGPPDRGDRVRGRRLRRQRLELPVSAAAEDLHDGVQQHRLVHRLDEEALEPGALGLRHDLLPAVGRHHDDGRDLVRPGRLA